MNWFIAHLIGDYILQNDDQALNKKSSTPYCLLHVALYTICIFVFTRWPWWALLITAVTHFAIDRTQFIRWWMRFNRQEKFRDNLGPWSMIVVDNVFHLIQLYATAALVAKYS